MRCIVYNWKKHAGSPEFDPSAPHEASIAVHTSKPSTGDVEAGRSKFTVIHISTMLKANLDYRRLCLGKEKKRNWEILGQI